VRGLRWQEGTDHGRNAVREREAVKRRHGVADCVALMSMETVAVGGRCGRCMCGFICNGRLRALWCHAT
jgi:hypothetical protein